MSTKTLLKNIEDSIEEIEIWIADHHSNFIGEVIENNTYIPVTIEIKTQDYINQALAYAKESGDSSQLPHLILTDDDNVVRYTHNNTNMFLNLLSYTMPTFQNFKLGEITQSDGNIYGIPFTSGCCIFL